MMRLRAAWQARSREPRVTDAHNPAAERKRHGADTIGSTSLSDVEVDPNSPDHETLFMGGLEEARALKRGGAQFRRLPDGKLRCTIDAVSVLVHTPQELSILRETFIDGGYDIRVPGPAVVWDIGMNVGFVSLYFASRGNIHVVGYEPIESTYRDALENLELNPALRDAITAINSGVGGVDRTVMVDYCPDVRGSVGLRGAAGDPVLRRLALHAPVDARVWKEALHMENAVSVLESVRRMHPELPIIAKIDCEGAEYEILEALHRGGELQSLHAVVVEWHLDGPGLLRDLLIEAGFTVLSPGLTNNFWGKLYAVR